MRAWAVAIATLASQPAAQGPGPLDWASVTVERRAFVEGQPGRYETVGRFDGVGMVYLDGRTQCTKHRSL